MKSDNKIIVNSCQFNYQYGDQIHFPYSIAMLISYLKNNPEINKKCKFEKTFVFRDKINKCIQECRNTDILLCSNYVWNWEITTFLAKNVRKINPRCLIVFGGPQVPLDTNDFFNKYPFVDILVHNEAEIIIENIFKAYLTDKNYSKINGITTKEFSSPPQTRIDNLNLIPSPYLTNLVWDLVEKVDGLKWICSWETNRGCPYQCTFCDWGSATFTIMRKFSEERLFKEIEWFADNKINYIDCCDSNFGIFPRDLTIARKLKEEALKKGYPETVRQSWAKNSSEKIIPIANELQTGGLLTAVGLAVESLDTATLEIIKRKNIQFEKFSELTSEFRAKGLPTYTEIIRGLPGETLQSFKSELENMVADSQIGSIYIYNCSVLPNAPLNESSYREKYKIKMVKSPIFLAHSSIHKRGIEEYEYIVTSTFSFTLAELKEMFLYSWMVITFQNLGILEYVSKFYNQHYNFPFMKFYELFLDYCKNNNSMFSLEYDKVIDYIEMAYSGKGWNHFDPNLGEIYWPIEEASWLRLISKKKNLENEIENFLNFLEDKLEFKTPPKILKELIKFQVFLHTIKDQNQKIKSENFEFNWKDFFVNKSTLLSEKKSYYYDNLLIVDDDIQWNYEVIWYGRRSKKFKFNPEFLKENKPAKEESNENDFTMRISTLKPPP